MIGTVTGTGRFEVIDNGEIIADIPTGMLSDPPTIERNVQLIIYQQMILPEYN